MVFRAEISAQGGQKSFFTATQLDFGLVLAYSYLKWFEVSRFRVGPSGTISVPLGTCTAITNTQKDNLPKDNHWKQPQGLLDQSSAEHPSPCILS